jgi:hypothetical protein
MKPELDDLSDTNTGGEEFLTMEAVAFYIGIPNVPITLMRGFKRMLQG